MKGDASATKDASPTPTAMRQISRLPNPGPPPLSLFMLPPTAHAQSPPLLALQRLTSPPETLRTSSILRGTAPAREEDL